jgi:hypothetical protein
MGINIMEGQNDVGQKDVAVGGKMMGIGIV